MPPCLAGAGRDGEAQEQSHGRGASELGVQGVLHLRRQLGVEGGDAHPEIWSEMEESRQHYGRAPCTPAPAGGCLGTGARQGGVGRTHGPPPPRGITAGWGARSWSPVPTPATGPASRTEGAGYMLPTGGRLSPLPLSIPAVRIPPAIRPPRPGPYPSLRPGARVAAGSCGGPRCAGSSPPARRWSRGTACRCSGPACAPTQCGCWRSALQGRARREAQRSPTSPLPRLGRGMLCPGPPPRPPASGSHAKWQHRVQGRRPRVPAASCWVPWGSAQLVLREQEPPCSEPHMHRGPLRIGGTPNLGAGHEAVPSSPDLPLPITSLHSMEQRAAVSSPALGPG